MEVFEGAEESEGRGRGAEAMNAQLADCNRMVEGWFPMCRLKISRAPAALFVLGYGFCGRARLTTHSFNTARLGPQCLDTLAKCLAACNVMYDYI